MGRSLDDSSNRRSPRRPTITTLRSVDRPDHLGAHQRLPRERSEAAPYRRSQGMASSSLSGHNRTSRDSPSRDPLQPDHVDLAAPARRDPGTAPSRPTLRGARARPTPPRGTPAPSAPDGAAPCAPATPACRSESSSARRGAPCRSDTNAQANREQHAAERRHLTAARAQSPPAQRPHERQVPHGRSGTSARAMSSARSPPPPGSLVLPDQTRRVRLETRLHWGCKKTGPGVHLRLFLGARGQLAGSK